LVGNSTKYASFRGRQSGLSSSQESVQSDTISATTRLQLQIKEPMILAALELRMPINEKHHDGERGRHRDHGIYRVDQEFPSDGN
jgi:hypothetical protein